MTPLVSPPPVSWHASPEQTRRFLSLAAGISDLLPHVIAPIASPTPEGKAAFDLQNTFSPAHKALVNAEPEDDRERWFSILISAYTALSLEEKRVGHLAPLCIAWLKTRPDVVTAAAVGESLRFLNQFFQACWDALSPSEQERGKQRTDVLVKQIDTLDLRLSEALGVLPLWPDPAVRLTMLAWTPARGGAGATHTESSIQAVDPAAAASSAAAADAAAEALKELQHTLDERFSSVPGLSLMFKTQERISEWRRRAKQIADLKGVTHVPKAPPFGAEGADPASAPAAPMPSEAKTQEEMTQQETTQQEKAHEEKEARVLRTRADAFRAVAEAAALLRRIEPHSPVPILLEKALAWGEMNFETLLKQWIRDEAPYRDVCRYIGLEEKKETIEKK